MDGRWAQLTIEAHIAHAIDYTRPVKPIVEQVVHIALLRKRRLAVANLYPALNDEGQQILITEASVDRLVDDCLFPWHRLTEEAGGPSKGHERSLADRVADLRRFRQLQEKKK